ncbi:MAG TPA: hypothetical protein DHM90_14140 [Clostridiaceae bacterium]|nr:hypothetical protein [Clostridiaceae bacterium]
MKGKDTVNYYSSPYQIGDLIEKMGLKIKEDFSEFERKELKKHLEGYMRGEYESDEIKIDMKKFFLIIKGADEASYLYHYLR